MLEAFAMLLLALLGLFAFGSGLCAVLGLVQFAMGGGPLYAVAGGALAILSFVAAIALYERVFGGPPADRGGPPK
jgi:hypothetical protein